MRELGLRFACRYVSYDDSKNITRKEAEALGASGISVVTNWEDHEGDMLEGMDAGVVQAKEALRLHTLAGGPYFRPIYFSVDVDASPAQLDACYDYLKGAATVLGWPYIGVYGGYRTLDYMSNKGIRFLWQTSAWSHKKTQLGVDYVEWHPKALIQQYKSNQPLAGGTISLDRSMAWDFGQWRR
jgi:hypothetical protein